MCGESKKLEVVEVRHKSLRAHAERAANSCSHALFIPFTNEIIILINLIYL